MRILVTGATGFVGSAVVQELKDAGHVPVGLARSDENAKKLASAGIEVHRGSIEDLASLRKGAELHDGIIHCAFIHDFSKIAESGVRDREAIEAIGGALVGSKKPFVVTSALGTLPPGQINDETVMPDPSSPGGHRAASEQAVLALGERGVRASIVRLPPSTHGIGDYAFVPALIKIAREKKMAAFVGDGRNRWAAVHRLDAANLFRLAAENGNPGDVFHAVADEGIPTRDLAELIARKLNVAIASKAPEKAAEHFGWITKFAALDMAGSSHITRKKLGWRPTHANLLADLEAGHYFE